MDKRLEELNNIEKMQEMLSDIKLALFFLKNKQTKRSKILAYNSVLKQLHDLEAKVYRALHNL